MNKTKNAATVKLMGGYETVTAIRTKLSEVLTILYTSDLHENQQDEGYHQYLTVLEGIE